MYRRGLLAVALAALGAAPAFASFDLVMVLDKATRKIHRFDGDSGAYLGAFGTFSSSVKSISLDQASGRVMVWDPGTNTVSTWDYSTGARVSSFGGFGSSYAYYGTWSGNAQYALAFTTNIEVYSTVNNAFVSSYASNVGSPQNIVRYGGEYYTFGTNGVQRNNSAFSFMGALTSVSLTSGAVVDSPLGAVAVAGVVGLNSGRLSYVSSNLGSSFTWGSTSLGAIRAVGPAHYGFYALGTNASNASQGRVVNYGWGGQGGGRVTEFNTFGESILQDPVGIVTVVAPEPATLGVLALGALALMRRRRA